MNSRVASAVLYALLAGQALFGAAAVASLALKADDASRHAERASVMASGQTTIVVR